MLVHVEHLSFECCAEPEASPKPVRGASGWLRAGFGFRSFGVASASGLQVLGASDWLRGCKCFGFRTALATPKPETRNSQPIKGRASCALLHISVRCFHLKLVHALQAFRVSGFGFRGCASRVYGFGFRASGLGVRVSASSVLAMLPSVLHDRIQGVSGLGFRV